MILGTLEVEVHATVASAVAITQSSGIDVHLHRMLQ